MLSNEHRDRLVESGIDPDLATNLGVRSILKGSDLHEHAPLLEHHGRNAKGIMFPWTSLADPEHTVTHIRVDNPIVQPDMTVQRYICPQGSGQVIARVRTALTPTAPILLIEGYKQALSAASAIETIDPESELFTLLDYGVCAIQGCWGTSTADISPLAGREVYVMFDADFATNPDVHRAAKRTLDQLTMIGASASFIKLPASQKDGLDDVLGRLPADLRATALHGLIGQATTRLGRAPAQRRPERHLHPVPDNHVPTANNPAFTMGRIPISQVVNELTPVCFLAGDGATSEDVLMYNESGVYMPLLKHLAEEITCSIVGEDEYAPTDTTKAITSLRHKLRGEGRVAPDFLPTPLLNCTNTLVNLDTGECYEHDPMLPTTIQIRTEYDPAATCPTFDAWLDEMLPDVHAQRVLLEHTAQVLDPTSIPARHLMLEGPPGTGKSTFLRLVQAIIAGSQNGRPRDHYLVESLPLETIANIQDRFAIGNLNGKIVNLAGDLAFSQFPDLAMWKQLTGEDYISADRKNIGRTRFRCKALFIFGMNAFPKVSDPGYFRRVTPVLFQNQIADRIDRGLETRLHEELSGILNRLILSWRATHARGRLLLADKDTLTKFEGDTNAVRRWFYSIENPFPQGWHEAAEVYRSYCAWCASEGESPQPHRSFTNDLGNIGVQIGATARKTVNKKTVRGYIFPHRSILDQRPDDGEGPPPDGFDPYDDEPTPPSPPSPAQESPVADIVVPAAPPKPGGEVIFDLETGSVEQVFTTPPEDFIRLMGWATKQTGTSTPPTTADPAVFKPTFDSAGRLVGQNIVGFDLIALHKAGWIDLDDVVTDNGKAPKVSDTMIRAMHLDPPPARQSVAGNRTRYSLKTLAENIGLAPDKDRLKELAKKYGGFDLIPQDDETYNAYLRDDVTLTSKVYFHQNTLLKAQSQESQDYLKREHRVVAAASLMRINGFRVDHTLLKQRLDVQNARRDVLISGLQSDYGLPTEGKAPHSSAAGKEALIRALKDKGAVDDDFMYTATGNKALSGDSMNKIMSIHPHNKAMLELCAAIQELQGQRSVYGTVFDNLHSDGRVHPEVSFRQASGRWSITKPGLSVFGKHTHLEEREIFLPDPGHVLISADFSQIDARCVAALSGDTNYLAMFAPGEDLHTAVALAIFNDASMREMAKKISHAWNYGASPGGIVFATGADIAVVEEYDRTARTRFAGVVAWRAGLVEQVNAGMMLNNGWGRSLNCDASRVETQSAGLVGQSCARDVAMHVLINRFDRDLRAAFRGFVHDEFLFSVPENQYDGYKARIEAAMNFRWRDVDIIAECGLPGVNWADAYRKD